jgi:glycosyltransferase involved in cell wall biosynthesis
MIGGNVGSSDGSNAHHARDMQALIADLGLVERIRWTGYVDPPLVSANLRACDVLVLPYRDGVSYRRGSFMAGLAHGCPIITTHPALALPDLRDGDNLRLIAPTDAHALADVLVELAGDGALRDRLSLGARQLSTLFTWDRIALQTVAVFEAAIRARANP